MTYFLNLRARPTGGGIRDSVAVNQVIIGPGGPVVSNPDPLTSDLAKRVLGKNVLLATHGFYVNQQDGYAELGNWQTLLQLDDSYLFIGIVWPGDSSWLGPFCYPGEGKHAIDCGNLLAKFISTYFAGANSISFVSHSLGARFVLATISKLNSSISVRQIALMAGAINDDCLTSEYRDAAARVGKIDILASLKDEVLSKAFPVGNILEGIIDKGHPYWSGALGHKGPRQLIPGKATGAYQIPSGWNYGHGNYIQVEPQLNPRLALPQDVQPEGDPEPTTQIGWQPSWSAAFVSTRFK
jgi:hypothetical protein